MISGSAPIRFTKTFELPGGGQILFYFETYGEKNYPAIVSMYQDDGRIYRGWRIFPNEKERAKEFDIIDQKYAEFMLNSIAQHRHKHDPSASGYQTLGTTEVPDEFNPNRKDRT